MNKYSYLIDNMTWSYSRLSAFETCPYGWLNKYIYEEPGVPRFFSSSGKFMHYLLQGYFEKTATREDLLVTYLTQFREFVDGRAPSAKVFETYFNDGINYLKGETLFCYPNPYTIVDVESEINFSIEGYPFTCFVDLNIEDDTGLVAVDHKSRIIKPPSGREKPTLYDIEREEMLRQLYVYCEAIKARFHQYPYKLIFNCFRVPTLITEDFNIEKLEATKKWAVDTIHTIQNTEVFEPKAEYFKCRYICDVPDCPYRDLV